MRNKCGIDCQKKHSDRTHDFHHPRPKPTARFGTALLRASTAASSVKSDFYSSF